MFRGRDPPLSLLYETLNIIELQWSQLCSLILPTSCLYWTLPGEKQPTEQIRNSPAIQAQPHSVRHYKIMHAKSSSYQFRISSGFRTLAALGHGPIYFWGRLTYVLFITNHLLQDRPQFINDDFRHVIRQCRQTSEEQRCNLKIGRSLLTFAPGPHGGGAKLINGLM